MAANGCKSSDYGEQKHGQTQLFGFSNFFNCDSSSSILTQLDRKLKMILLGIYLDMFSSGSKSDKSEKKVMVWCLNLIPSWTLPWKWALNISLSCIVLI